MNSIIISERVYVKCLFFFFELFLISKELLGFCQVLQLLRSLNHIFTSTIVHIALITFMID
uniref:Uncharacterized protein n=1 Tax=Rhizophora mucronata TaxID=61149 RepID=A0A2P2MLG8_RHIMU